MNRRRLLLPLLAALAGWTAAPALSGQGEGHGVSQCDTQRGPASAPHPIPTRFPLLLYYELWPGIAMTFMAEPSRRKTTFLVRPGADPGLIRLLPSAEAGE